jgi:hypothetical protein
MAAGRRAYVHNCLTNYHFCVQGNHWLDVWFPHVRMSECNGLAITLQFAGCPPMALLMPGPDWWYVMFQKLAYNRIVVPLGLITTFRRLVLGTEAAPVPLVRSGISEIAMTRRQDFARLTN